MGNNSKLDWQPISTAPSDGTEIQARIPGNGEDNVIAWVGDLIDSNGEYCGAWAFTREQEPPDCWTDGYCWEVNEDGDRSVQPTHWTPPHHTGEAIMTTRTQPPEGGLSYTVAERELLDSLGGYQRVFNAIADATSVYARGDGGSGIEISVHAFIRSLNPLAISEQSS